MLSKMKFGTQHQSSASLFICLLLQLLAATPSEGTFPQQECYVKPNTSSTCHTNTTQCRILMWYVDHPHDCFNTNWIMIFLPGMHILTAVLNITGVENFTLQGNETGETEINVIPLPESRIICGNSGGGFVFMNSSKISVRHISVENCGANMTFIQNKYTVHAAVALSTSQNISFFQVLINNSAGYGLHVDQWLGSFDISHSAFMHSHPYKEFANVHTGNIHFWFENDTSVISSVVNMSIKDSWIMYGIRCDINNSKTSQSAENFGIGLTLYIFRPLVFVSIVNVTFKNNTTPLGHGGNIAIEMAEFGKNSSRVVIENSHIENGGAGSGGGLAFSLSSNELMPLVHYQERGIGTEQQILVVINTIFASNFANLSGGAVYIRHFETSQVGDCVMKTIYFQNCQFIENWVNHSGAAVMIVKHKLPNSYYSPHITPMFSVDFDNSTFLENKLKAIYPGQANEDGVVDVFSEEKITIRNSKFIENNGTPILLTASNLILEQFNLFQGNNGSYGGAIKICDQAQLFLKRGTHVKFVGNRATQSGGAIYTEQQCLNSAIPCFFQPEANVSKVEQLRELFKLEFVNNSAGIAGHAIYGGSVDNCFTYQKFSLGNNDITYFNSYAIFNSTFDFSPQKQPSQVTSDPYGVCLCDPMDNSIYCSSIDIKTYPGQTFNISASAVGQTHGSVPALLIVENTDTNDSSTKIVRYDGGNLQMTTSVLCQTMTIAVFSREPSIVLAVNIHQSYPASERSNYYKISKQKINVTLYPCPWLFEFSNNASKCDCIHLLHKFGVKCDINSESFHRSDTGLWIGCANYNSFFIATNDSLPTCTSIGLYNFCDQDHCVNFIGNLTTRNISHLCKEGRGGVMCGSCIDGYSLAFGPLSNCVEDCQLWKTFLLLLVFILAGILIIFFVTIINMTVSEGTIGGLLFYANFVHANRESFFPASEIGLKNSFLMVFIAWLNLDLGFEVCFYEGMDAYQKQWLEFGFLLYLLFLEVLIIFLCHKFIFFTRIIGRNAVSVLSTVILLAYPKLVYNCTNILHYARLHLSDGTKKVWIGDGNINYLQGKHIPLAVMAILLFMIIITYTLCLLFIQCLQRKSNWFILRWVQKLRPFFDSFTGPCRDNYRFWPGLLLFIRLALYSVYTVMVDEENLKLYIIMAFCIIIFILACVSPNGVYKKWPLNILEFSFILNLGLLSGFVVSLRKVPTPMVFTYPSVGIAMITFHGILIYHISKRVKSTRRWRRLSATFMEKFQRFKHQRRVPVVGHFEQSDINALLNSRDSESSPLLSDGRSHFIQVREPLLEDSSN